MRYTALAATIVVLVVLQKPSLAAQIPGSYRPPFLPVSISVDSSGRISVSGEASVATPLGTCSVGADYDLKTPKGHTLVVIRRGPREEVYKLRAGNAPLTVVTQSEARIEIRDRQIRIDVSDGRPATFYFRRELPLITNSLGMKLTFIPAGEFLMGSPEGEAGALPGEKPRHLVHITKPYYLSAYEVTQGEYERVMGTNPSKFSSVSGQDISRFPVEQVSWEEAVDCCRKLSALSAEQSFGRAYRLPTEAEWEHACRAGTATPFHFGSQLNGRDANCDGESPYGTTSRGTYLKRPTAVGSYAANAFGLYDMHGNVSEWCADWKAEYAATTADDPMGPTAGSYRVVRGGGWLIGATFCRSAYRPGQMPGGRSSFVGFRVACTSVDASGR